MPSRPPVPDSEPNRPDYFQLAIWSDVAADDPCNLDGYSHPGEKIWQYDAHDYDEVLIGYDNTSIVYPGLDRESVFRYSVRLPEEEWFCQEDINDVFWLSIMAVYENQVQLTEHWAWMNHEHSYNDNAVRSWHCCDEWEWEEIYNPDTEEPWDLSFLIFTEPEVCCECADYDKSGIVDFNDLAKFADEWLWTGQAGGYNISDLDCDGDVQFTDFAIFADQWLDSCP